MQLLIRIFLSLKIESKWAEGLLSLDYWFVFCFVFVSSIRSVVHSAETKIAILFCFRFGVPPACLLAFRRMNGRLNTSMKKKRERKNRTNLPKLHSNWSLYLFIKFANSIRNCALRHPIMIADPFKNSMKSARQRPDQKLNATNSKEVFKDARPLAIIYNGFV